MLVNKKTKWKSRIVALSLLAALLTTGSAVGVQQSATAYLTGKTYKNTSVLTTTSNWQGRISTENTGANTTVRGYAIKKINLLPDSTVASTPWVKPQYTGYANFTHKKGQKFYGQIYGQTVNSRGNIKITTDYTYK